MVTAVPSLALAQDWDQAVMGTVASYENSKSICYYAPEVGPIIDKMNDYLASIYGGEWTAGLQQLQARLTPMANAWQLGGVPECKFYGQAVARGLQIAPIMVGIGADAEVARLTTEGGRRIDGSVESVPPPHNDMADSMEQYDANIHAGDIDLLSVDDGRDRYKIYATDVQRDGVWVSMLLEARGTRLDHRNFVVNCSDGSMRSYNEFNVQGGGEPDIKGKMEEAQQIAGDVFCDTSGGD